MIHTCSVMSKRHCYYKTLLLLVYKLKVICSPNPNDKIAICQHASQLDVIAKSTTRDADNCFIVLQRPALSSCDTSDIDQPTLFTFATAYTVTSAFPKQVL